MDHWKWGRGRTTENTATMKARTFSSNCTLESRTQNKGAVSHVKQLWVKTEVQGESIYLRDAWPLRCYLQSTDMSISKYMDYYLCNCFYSSSKFRLTIIISKETESISFINFTNNYNSPFCANPWNNSWRYAINKDGLLFSGSSPSSQETDM